MESELSGIFRIKPGPKNIVLAPPRNQCLLLNQQILSIQSGVADSQTNPNSIQKIFIARN